MRGLRPGTLPVALMVALGKATELALNNADKRNARCEVLTSVVERLDARLAFKHGITASAALRSANGSDLSALATTAEELIAAIGFETGDAHAGRHLDTFEHLPCFGIQSPQIAFVVVFPSAVPEFSVNPGDPCDVTVGLDRATNRTGLRINLMDFAVVILPHPERTFTPRQTRVAIFAGRRDRGKHTASFRINLLDAPVGDLKQVPAVERRSSIRRDLKRSFDLSAFRIEAIEFLAGGEPNGLAIVRKPMHSLRAREWTIFTNDFRF